MSDWEDLIFITNSGGIGGWSPYGDNPLGINVSGAFISNSVPGAFTSFRGFAFSSDYSKIIVSPTSPDIPTPSLYYFDLVSTPTQLTATWGGAYMTLPAAPDMVYVASEDVAIQTGASYWSVIHILQQAGVDDFLIAGTVRTPTDRGDVVGPAYIRVVGTTPTAPSENWLHGDSDSWVCHHQNNLYYSGSAPWHPADVINGQPCDDLPLPGGGLPSRYAAIWKKAVDEDDPAAIVGGNVQRGHLNEFVWGEPEDECYPNGKLLLGNFSEFLSDGALPHVILAQGTIPFPSPDEGRRLVRVSGGGAVVDYPGASFSSGDPLFGPSLAAPSVGQSYLHSERSYVIGAPDGANPYSLYKNNVPVLVGGSTHLFDMGWDTFSQPRCYRYSLTLFPPPPPTEEADKRALFSRFDETTAAQEIAVRT